MIKQIRAYNNCMKSCCFPACNVSGAVIKEDLRKEKKFISVMSKNKETSSFKVKTKVNFLLMVKTSLNLYCFTRVNICNPNRGFHGLQRGFAADS